MMCTNVLRRQGLGLSASLNSGAKLGKEETKPTYVVKE
jgi:hypothetical protein